MTIPKLSTLELQQIAKPFDHPDWIFEIKYGGFGALAQIENGACRLISRKDNVYTRFDDLRKAIPSDVKSDELVLDGEIAVLDSGGKSLFKELMHTRSTPIFAACDILWLNGEDLANCLCSNAKKILSKVVRSRPKRMLYVDHIARNGQSDVRGDPQTRRGGHRREVGAQPVEVHSRPITADQDQERDTQTRGGRAEMFNRRG